MLTGTPFLFLYFIMYEDFSKKTHKICGIFLFFIIKSPPPPNAATSPRALSAPGTGTWTPGRDLPEDRASAQQPAVSQPACFPTPAIPSPHCPP